MAEAHDSVGEGRDAVGSSGGAVVEAHDFVKEGRAAAGRAAGLIATNGLPARINQYTGCVVGSPSNARRSGAVAERHDSIREGRAATVEAAGLWSKRTITSKNNAAGGSGGLWAVLIEIPSAILIRVKFNATRWAGAAGLLD